nr:MAG: capsid protein [Cressdnaviricota sp.]
MAFKTKSRARRTGHSKRKHTVRRSSSRRGKSSFSKKVMKVVHKAEQTKNVCYASNFTIGNANSLTPIQIAVGVNPTNLGIVQGTGAGDRLGDRVHIKKVTFRAIMTPVIQTAVVNTPIALQEVRVAVLKNKLAPQSGIVMANLFQYGSTNVPPNSTLTDMIQPFNKEASILFKNKTFKCGMSAYTANTPNFINCNNDFKVNNKFTWDLTKASPKVCQFSGSTAASQVSAIPWMLFMVSAADGTSVATQSQAVSVQYSIDVEFTDF